METKGSAVADLEAVNEQLMRRISPKSVGANSRRSVPLHLCVRFQVSGHESQLIRVTLIGDTASFLAVCSILCNT